ncbi:MAG: prepilin-type N-terminal cleavage/methylation domain-containing protein [Elusimicrobiaceae bacterium]|nr:prepilin-type N-terminal cleavage/methylation domain-containing protein [Elusimicrobiaceae bacterium]
MYKQGFTMIELLTVVLIIGILTAIAVPQYRKSLDRSRMAEAYSVMPAIRDSILRYMTENNLSLNLSSITWDFTYPAWTNNVSFASLDVTMKGHQSPSNQHKWITKNFEYEIFPAIYLAEWGYNLSRTPIKAKFLRGRFKDLTFYYSHGKTFFCEGQAGVTEETFHANCDTLGLPLPADLPEANNERANII